MKITVQEALDGLQFALNAAEKLAPLGGPAVGAIVTSAAAIGQELVSGIEAEEVIASATDKATLDTIMQALDAQKIALDTYIAAS